jgi:hypothetical protein
VEGRTADSGGGPDVEGGNVDVESCKLNVEGCEPDFEGWKKWEDVEEEGVQGNDVDESADDDKPVSRKSVYGEIDV